MPAVERDGLGSKVCTGPVTPSTGPVHTSLRPPSRPMHESPFRKWRFGGTMSDDVNLVAVDRGRETETHGSTPSFR